MGIEWRLDQLVSGPRELALLGLWAVGTIVVLAVIALLVRTVRRRRKPSGVTDMDVLAEAIAMRVAARGRGPSGMGASGLGASALPTGVAALRGTSGAAMRVMLFIDYPNFLRNFRNRAQAAGLGDARLDWPNLPRLVIDEIAALGVWPATELRFVTAHVYDSYIPFEVLARHGVSLQEAHDAYGYQGRAFLLDTLALVPGYEIHIFDRVLRYAHGGAPKRDGETGQLASGEKGVDTSLVADMVAHAATGALDLAVVLSDDTDCIPAIETLQQRLGVPVIQMGFALRGTARRAAWRNITVDRRTMERLAQASRLGAPVRMVRRAMSGKPTADVTGAEPAAVQAPPPVRRAPSPAPRAPAQEAPAPVPVVAAPPTPRVRETPPRNPDAEAHLAIGSVYEAKVSNVRNFGVFGWVETPAGPVKVMIHRTQVGLPEGSNLQTHFKTGQTLRIEVLDLDAEGRRRFKIVADEQAVGSPAPVAVATAPAEAVPPAPSVHANGQATSTS